ncbi:hypothetical protein [uncultured Ruegeria sp.]|nr:hypothetical protein [uncultured Ruegeria sp.]
MGFAAPLAMVAGTVISTIGAFKAADSMEDAAAFNTHVQNTQARQIERQATADVASHRRDFEKFRGALTSDLAAYGGSASSGTGLLLAQEAARQAKLDELNIITQGQNRANMTRVGAQIGEHEASIGAYQRRMGGLGTAMEGFSRAAVMAADLGAMQ